MRVRNMMTNLDLVVNVMGRGGGGGYLANQGVWGSLV